LKRAALQLMALDYKRRRWAAALACGVRLRGISRELRPSRIAPALPPAARSVVSWWMACGKCWHRTPTTRMRKNVRRPLTTKTDAI